jgi:hypothetical protein
MLTNNNIIFYSQIQQLNDVVDEMILKLNGEADNTTLIKCSEYVIKVAHSLIITDIHIRINDPEKQYFVSLIELLKHLIKYVIYTVYDKEDEEIEKTFYFMN